MHSRASTICLAALLLCAPLTSRAAVTPYSQNFESLVKSNPAALSGDGWIVYGNVYNPPHTLLYGYGPFPAPNGSGGFCAIDTLQGGPLQGNLQLSVYSDYNNTGAHGAGQLVESNVYHEQTIAAGDVGGIWTFQFDAKLGNLVSPSTAMGFIKTLNPATGYTLTNFFSANTTAIPASWNTYSVSITIDASLVGQLIQLGFANTATNFVSSAVFYDNLVWSRTGTTGVGAPLTRAFELSAAAPNPFGRATRFDFSVERRGPAELRVYDTAGRRIATLFDGIAEPGAHSVIWDGRSESGRQAPSGLYLCTLRMASGRQTRRVILGR